MFVSPAVLKIAEQKLNVKLNGTPIINILRYSVAPAKTPSSTGVFIAIKRGSVIKNPITAHIIPKVGANITAVSIDFLTLAWSPLP